jgi:signal transduction histidine kinase
MRRSTLIRLGILVLLIAVITALHYLTTLRMAQFHDIYRRLYYIPIVLGGLWFTLRGGLGTSIVISILFAPHVVFQWGHHPTSQPEQYLEILLYNVIGFLTGFLAERERIQKEEQQQATSRLEESYSTLRQQADLILEIEEQLRRADRLSALGELSAGMAHEIRNPLGAIRGTAEILQEGIPPEDKRYEFACILIREVDRLNRVVQDFLRFAKPAPVERGRFDVHEVLREIILLTRQQAVKNSITLELREGSLPVIAGDREQLKQAFLNLILNALQAMPYGGTLTITTQLHDARAVILFTDTGQGIPPADLERIFNPFFTTRKEGTGLGLAISHRIVQGHGGRIDVTSSPGEGTTFTVLLPLSEDVQ